MKNLYDLTVPIFTKSLGGLENILRKAEEFVRASGLDETGFLQERLAPDMFPLVRQVQIVCDNAKASTARLTGIENPKHEDKEQTFAELYDRIHFTLNFLKSVQKESFEGAEERKVELPYFPGKHFIGFDYLREYALPNFFFHLTTAYGIIRHKGVAIGKKDYLNGLSLHDN